eukprot:Lithocolla_globosa_v1_NODE_1465_length_2556_cov_9.319472.p2 type:complete len:105 gc:universal NODE_1465_length_2556_cov_9.319472:1357-1043(-)
MFVIVKRVGHLVQLRSVTPVLLDILVPLVPFVLTVVMGIARMESVGMGVVNATHFGRVPIVTTVLTLGMGQPARKVVLVVLGVVLLVSLEMVLVLAFQAIKIVG